VYGILILWTYRNFYRFWYWDVAYFSLVLNDLYVVISTFSTITKGNLFSISSICAFGYGWVANTDVRCSLLIWFGHLERKGRGDYTSLHCSCPLAEALKWWGQRAGACIKRHGMNVPVNICALWTSRQSGHKTDRSGGLIWRETFKLYVPSTEKRTLNRWWYWLWWAGKLSESMAVFYFSRWCCTPDLYRLTCSSVNYPTLLTHYCNIVATTC